MSARRTLTALAASATLGIAALGTGIGASNAAAGDTEVGDTVEMENFTVTVGEPWADGGILRSDLTVCATNVPDGETVRVSWDVWTLVGPDGTHHPAGGFGMMDDLPDYPYGDTGNPENTQERWLANGECATGDIGWFEVEGANAIAYNSSLGDHSVWNF